MDDAKPGHDVNFHSLKGAAHLNGTTGTLVKYLKEEERWSVRRSNGQLVNAKPGNLERVRANDNETKLISTMLEEARKRTAQKTNKHQGRGLEPLPPPSFVLKTADEVHHTLLEGYHKRRMGGVVVSCGDLFMVAIEFYGPYSGDGIQGEMVCIDKGNHRNAQAILKERKCQKGTELGRFFLLGEKTEYIEVTSDATFFKLLGVYQRTASSKGYVDVKSGLPIHDVKISK